jgi:hypothetical protein
MGGERGERALNNKDEMRGEKNERQNTLHRKFPF